MGKMQNEDLVISKNIPSLLQDVPFHSRNDAIDREMPEGFPVYLAVHTIRNADGVSKGERYVSLHKHNAPEINILIGDGDTLRYEIQTESRLYKVESPASVYIPAGVAHAPNHVSGKGFYVCIILSDKESAFTVQEKEE
jgi:hypothetical protein